MVTKKLKVDHLSGKCLPDMLREQADLQPGQMAVVTATEGLTYAELAARSSDLAAYLLQLGVAPDDCVGLFVQPSIDLMVGAWGVLSSGCAYLPLSPEYPEDRLRYMIEHARVKVIIAPEGLQDRLAELSPHGTVIVTPKEVAAFVQATDGGERKTATSLRPHHLAYVIYTSGSTGKPKGVMIEHRSIVNQLNWLRSAHGLDPSKVVLQKTPMSFDAAQWEILAPACGSTVVMGAPGVYGDPEGLIDTIVAHEVTTLQTVPTLLAALLDTERLGTCTSLRQVFSGGEALSKSLAIECLDELPDCELTNIYGPTECTINSSAFTVDRLTAAAGPDTISIGKPVHNTQYYILDSLGAPLPAGQIGELYIGGVQLARGYLHRPDLVAERFVDNVLSPEHLDTLLFRTGDLAFWNADGTVQFAGRIDNQVKLRGFRVELDEIRLAIESHNWVKHAAVVVRTDPRTGYQTLTAFGELNPKEAALMDQGNHGAHHQSKASRLQTKAQLSNPGCRDAAELSGKLAIDLAGVVPTTTQRSTVFARKTYRFFEGGEVKRADILRLLGRPAGVGISRRLEPLDFAEFGEILRYFGQYLSAERLLPKYGYASPGSLYATQLYLELNDIAGLAPGYYYYHPERHQLILIRPRPAGETAATNAPRIKLHFIGKKRAIQPVYQNNIEEVLEIETGHMVGLFEEILPGYGLAISDLGYEVSAKPNLECAAEDCYLGTFEIRPYAGHKMADSVEVYVQAHPGRIGDLPAGQYRYRDGSLEKISDDLVLKKHVIAINQQVYERSSLGITVVSKGPEGWRSYIDLGRKLQQLQMNDFNLGFMASGYSSKSGNDLPAAKRMADILNAGGEEEVGPSYFFVGGRVSNAQLRGEGMKEDVVHMKGPAEMIKADLADFLPDYMLPNRVIVLDKLPLTPNGKIDTSALAGMNLDLTDRPFVAPRTEAEERIAALWKKGMKQDSVSVQDDFFESGGNSLIAVGLVNKINQEFRSALPLQVIFECPTIERIAHRLGNASAEPFSRLVQLHAEGAKSPVFCWPGLGGYTMNLRLLAGTIDLDRPFYGVQAHGINVDEVAYPTIKEMAAADVAMIHRLQPVGPYTLWGYSFGARLAFETAYQLEQAGAVVENLFLIAPGSPRVRPAGEPSEGRESTYANREYVTILYSVFAGSIAGAELEECLKVAVDDETFAAFISARYKGLDPGLVRRVVRIVHQTYSFEYAFHELVERRLAAPTTIFKAAGDDYSFIESTEGFSAVAPAVFELDADHYSMLKDPGVDELVKMIRHRLHVGLDQTRPLIPKETIVPHVSIKHFPVALSEAQQAELVTAVTRAVSDAFSVDEGVISIALEPVEADVWNELVYEPEIVNRKELLCKSPNY